MGQFGDRVVAAVLLVASSVYVVADGTIAVLLALMLTVAQIAPLLWARRRPALVFGLLLVTFAAHIVLLPEFLPADLALLVAAFGVIVVHGWWPAGIGAIVGSGAALVVALPVCTADRGLGATAWEAYVTAGVGVAAATLATALLAELHRARAQLLLSWQERATSAEREREQVAVIAAQAERARLARDVHDTVAHALVVITMHGEVARRALGAGHDAQVEQLLTTLATTAREALAETRELVRVLAMDGVTPAVGVEALPEMVERLRRSGRAISLDMDDDEDFSLPLDVSHTVYRVVQEAVTNALKHGGAGAAVSISVCRNGPAVEVVVVDDGTGSRVVPAPGAGHGLRGLRERVEAVGGRFSAGPRATRGFRVWAELPVITP